MVSIFPNPCLWRRSLCSNLGGIDLEKLYRATLNDADSVSIAQLSVACYFFRNFSRQSQNRGGGSGIVFRDSVNVSLVDGNENKSFEYSEWIVKVHDRSMRHIMVY